MTAGLDPAAAGEWARRVTDLGASPEGLGRADRRALAWALKELCYSAWNTDPLRAARAADALGRLAEPAAPTDAQDAEIAALARWTAGIAHLTRGRMAEALPCFDAAHEALRALGLAGPAAETRVPRIMALALLDRHAEAVAAAEEAQRELVAAGDLAGASRVSLNLGSLHMRHDDYAEAARHYREAVVLFSRAGDPEHSVMADIGLADALTALGDLGEAERIYARAQQRAQNHRLPVLQALVDESIALLDLARGRYGAALAGFESARRRYAALQMPQHLATAEKQLADAYLETRLLPEAVALYDTALAAFDAPGDQAWTLAQRGRAEVLLGRPEAAAATFARAAELFDAQDNTAGRAAVSLAHAELALSLPAAQAYGDALAAAQAALNGYTAAASKHGAARASVVLAQALLQAGHVGDARARFAEALAEARSAGLLSVQVRCHTGLGLAALAQHDETAAQAAFEAAVDLLEDQRRALPGDELRSAFLTDHLRPYAELLRLALRRHERVTDGGDAEDPAAAALQAHERFRARVLSERLADAGPRPGESRDEADLETAALRTRYHWLHRRAHGAADETTPSAALAEELRRAESQLLERARRARLTAPAGPPTAHADTPFDVQTLRAQLGERDALVAYGVVDDELLAWIVRRDGIHLQRRIAPWPQVQDALRSARFQIETLGHGSELAVKHLAALSVRAQARMQHLHELVWAPLQAALASAERLLINAPGALGALPFAALHDGRQPLAQRHQIAHAPSARIAARGLCITPVAPEQLLVLADTKGLAHAQTEADRVARMFGQAAIYSGDQATLRTLRAHAGDADVLHLACHARFRSDNPAFSALHLVDAPLTAEEAETLRLKAGVVVLSACETGLAAGGDEMVGLVRAFLVAGAARVVASLWAVDDAVTALFMAHFYGALSRRRSPGEALMAAQAAVMRQHPHPYYWAAFILHGGW